jgi:hypothetical protein
MFSQVLYGYWLGKKRVEIFAKAIKTIKITTYFEQVYYGY